MASCSTSRCRCEDSHRDEDDDNDEFFNDSHTKMSKDAPDGGVESSAVCEVDEQNVDNSWEQEKEGNENSNHDTGLGARQAVYIGCSRTSSTDQADEREEEENTRRLQQTRASRLFRQV